MKRKIFLIVMACVAIVSLHAQVVTWAVKPGTYSKIEPCWGDMYFAYSGNNVGIINGDGRVIVEPEATRITGFYGGLALVLKSDGGKERILGILSTDGSYSKIDGTYFVIPYQEFFSEGLLTVTTPRGKAGYMNANGSIVQEFNVSFVSPFSEGYAVVGEDRDYTLVDKRFNRLNIQLGTVSQVYGGANVYKGVAVIWDGEGRFYNFDVNRGTCQKISKPSSLDYDYMFCLSSVTKRPGEISYENPMRSSQTLATTEQGGKYGYMNGNKTVLPCQFEQAEHFYGNYAIVKSAGSYGLLALHNTNDSFGARSSNSEISYRKSAQKGIKHKFDVSLPDLWNGDMVSVKLKDENGMLVNTKNSGNSYEFQTDGSTGTKNYSVEIDADGLRLWNGEIAYNYHIEKEPDPVVENNGGGNTGGGSHASLSVSLKMLNTNADKNDHCCVRATISNSGATSVTTSVSCSATVPVDGATKTVTVPAKGSATVDFNLKVKKASSGVSVTVSTRAGGSGTLSGLQLIPF